MSDRFRFGAHIGSGGFGSVEEATRIHDGGFEEEGLACKRLLDKWLDQEEAVERFKREVRLLDEMDHPNILPVLGRNLSAVPPWFVMPRAETNLSDLIPFLNGDVEKIADLFVAVLNGMAYAHTNSRVVHRDLKPENVLIVNGVPMISDFGLGRRLDPDATDLTRTHIGMGTMAYMAPEQFTDAKHVGPAADVYALGKMLWEMLSDRRPVVGRPSLDVVPGEFRSFIGRCTADDAVDRFASASDALVAFQLLVGRAEAASYVGKDLEEQLRLWETTDEGEDAKIVEGIARTLVARREDEELYFQVVPRLPHMLIEQLVADWPTEFDVILRAYNGHIQGGLPFDYCDVVANFYRYVFDETKDFDQRILILDRLIDLGPSHNRWYVGEVTAQVLASITDAGLADEAVGILNADQHDAAWLAHYVSSLNLLPQLEELFQNVAE